LEPHRAVPSKKEKTVIHIYTHIYTHTHIYIYIYIYVYIYINKEINKYIYYMYTVFGEASLGSHSGKPSIKKTFCSENIHLHIYRYVSLAFSRSRIYVYVQYTIYKSIDWVHPNL